MKEEDLYVHTDDTLLRALRDSPSEIASKLASALWDRQLYKAIGNPYGHSAFHAIHSGDIEHNAKDLALATLGASESRRLIENELAERIRAEHGDVLIYAPPEKMNPKVADINVRWHGQDKKFKEIDDAIMKPRLEQIINSHHMLWGIHLLASKDIVDDAERRDLLRDAFESEFLCVHTEKAKRGLNHYEKVVDLALREGAYSIPLDRPYSDIKKRIKDAAQALTTTSKDPRSFHDRLDEAITKYVCRP